MDILLGTFGSLMGALLGAVLWIAVGYFTGYEVGYVAWAVGLCAGAGMRLSCNCDGKFSGIIAVVVALTAIVGAKATVVCLQLQNASEQLAAADFERHDMIATMAKEIIAEIEEQGKSVELPAAFEDDAAPYAERFPLAVWKAATICWDQMTAAEQEAHITAQHPATARQFGTFVELCSPQGQAAGLQMLQASFSPFDLIWFGLAAATAFKLGTVAEDEDDGDKQRR